MNKDTLHARTGGLSQTSKMPGPSWSISPDECRTGSKMARVPGTICARCYARKGKYRFPSTVNAHSRRLAAYRKDPGGWADAMIELIEPHKWFRWFDAGDLQDPDIAKRGSALGVPMGGVLGKASWFHRSCR